MLTPADIRKPSNLSGYRNVSRKNGERPGRGHGQRGYRYQAFTAGGHSERPNGWQGPTRRTALEAAQDYCDRVNNTPAAQQTPALKAAGHKRPATPATRKPSLALRNARSRVRYLEAQEKVGLQGFLYLIGMEYPTAYPPRDPSRVNITAWAVKIGWSENPQARIATLQTGNPCKLVLLAMKPGTLEDERALHAKYLNVNILQEWFRPTLPLLLEFGLRITIQSIDRIQVEGVVTPV